MKHTRTIEHGVTIINTHDAVGGIKNTSGHVGVAFLEEPQKWVAKIFIGKKYYHLGRFENVKDAIAIRAEAEKHRADGTFLEWFPTLQGKTKRKSPKK